MVLASNSTLRKVRCCSFIFVPLLARESMPSLRPRPLQHILEPMPLQIDNPPNHKSPQPERAASSEIFWASRFARAKAQWRSLRCSAPGGRSSKCPEHSRSLTELKHQLNHPIASIPIAGFFFPQESLKNDNAEQLSIILGFSCEGHVARKGCNQYTPLMPPAYTLPFE